MMNKIVSDTYIFNKAGGCPIDLSSVNLRGGLALVESELEETEAGLSVYEQSNSEQGLVEIADGAADVIVTAIGLLYRAGFTQSQVNDVLSVVGEANKAKFDDSEEDAKESVRQYETDPRYTNVHYEQRGRRFAIIGTVVSENGAVRKILKSHKWEDPEDFVRDVVVQVLGGNE